VSSYEARAEVLHHHTVTPSHRHTATPSHHHTVTPLHHHTITPSHRHTVTLLRVTSITIGTPFSRTYVAATVSKGIDSVLYDLILGFRIRAVPIIPCEFISSLLIYWIFHCKTRKFLCNPELPLWPVYLFLNPWPCWALGAGDLRAGEAVSLRSLIASGMSIMWACNDNQDIPTSAIAHNVMRSPLSSNCTQVVHRHFAKRDIVRYEEFETSFTVGHTVDTKGNFITDHGTIMRYMQLRTLHACKDYVRYRQRLFL